MDSKRSSKVELCWVFSKGILGKSLMPKSSSEYINGSYCSPAEVTCEIWAKPGFDITTSPGEREREREKERKRETKGLLFCCWTMEFTVHA
jgi:hypothetical protein